MSPILLGFQSHIAPVSRYKQIGGSVEILFFRDLFTRVDRTLNAGHLDEFVEECTIRCVPPNFETEDKDVLMERIALFREFRGVSSYSTLR